MAGVDLREYGLDYHVEKPDHAKQTWDKAIMFFVFGLILLFMLFFVKRTEIDGIQLFLFLLMTVLMFFGFAAHVYLFWKIKTPEEPGENGQIAFICKHCGKGFSNEKLWRYHEKSCTRMKL